MKGLPDIDILYRISITRCRVNEQAQAASLLGRDNPWWVAKETGEILGIVKHRDAIAKLDSDEKCPMKLDGPCEVDAQIQCAFQHQFINQL